MSPNGRRAWRAAAKKLRRAMGQRWRSPETEWMKRWSEGVTDLDAHRGRITGSWFRRHGHTVQGLQTLDANHLTRVYIGFLGAVDGEGVEYAVEPKSITARSLVGMTMGARKRAAQSAVVAELGVDRAHAYTREYGSYLRSGEYLGAYWTARAKYRIGQKLRPCVGCLRCKCRSAFEAWPELGEELAKDHPTCDGSGVLPARRSK